MTYFQNRQYLLGITWFILSIVISNVNDIIMKKLGYDLHPMQVAFCRFFFGTMSLIPLMIYFGKKSFVTKRYYIHITRGVLLFFGISIWCFGLSIVPITTATILTFTIPLFVLVMAPIFLGEKVSTQLWVVTILGFVGVLIVFNPTSASFQPIAIIMLISSLMFASLDIINKKFVASESMLSMLFYSAVVTTILSIYPAYLYWQSINSYQLFLMAVMGVFSNLILFCLLKSFSIVNASAVAPYRYLELVLSGVFGYVLFHEIPELTMYIGAAIIIPSTFYVGYHQLKWGRKSEKLAS